MQNKEADKIVVVADHHLRVIRPKSVNECVSSSQPESIRIEDNV